MTAVFEIIQQKISNFLGPFYKCLVVQLFSARGQVMDIAGDTASEFRKVIPYSVRMMDPMTDPMLAASDGWMAVTCPPQGLTT